MKHPTMKDVAERAGVSKATVSHVINRTRFVSGNTTERVLRAIRELGYRPSAVARSLTTKRTQAIGLLVSDITNHFFAELLRGIEDVLRPQDYSISVCSTAEVPAYEANYLDLLLRQRVDGLIAAASQRWGVLAEFETQHTPVVFVDRYFEELGGPFVGVDNRREAYRGVSYLIARGHRQLAILAGALQLSSLRGRLEGFRLALEEHGLSLPEEWVISRSPDETERLRHILLAPEHPTAIFCSVSSLSLLLLSTLRELGLRCPEDVALLGFDDHPWAAVSDPPLTVIRQPGRRIGQVAAESLLQLIQGHGPAEARVIMDCELIVRQSC
jgi:LacI family transcriptional regulator